MVGGKPARMLCYCEWLSGKEYMGSIPWLGRSPGKENGYPLQYSGLENSMDYIVYRVVKSRAQLSNFHFTSNLERT